MKHSTKLVMKIVLWFIYCLQSLIYLFAGSIHLDEGAYLYAARAVYKGTLPYRDFFFLQPPLHPYIYGIFQKIAPGLLVGRLTSIVCGIISVILLCKLARKLTSSDTAVILFLALITMTPFQIYFFSITRLYSLTMLFISLGCYFLFSEKSPSTFSLTIGLIAFSAALGTRLTVLPLFFYGVIYTMIRGKKAVARFIPVFCAVLFLIAIYTPFVLTAGRDRLWFNLLGMNLSLHSNNIEANLIQKARATAQLIRFYFPAWILLIPISVSFIKQIKEQSIITWIKRIFSSEGSLWCLTLGMLLVHSSAKLYQVSYQTIVMPLLLLMVAIVWSRKYDQWNAQAQRYSRMFVTVIFFISILAYGRTSISIAEGKPSMLALWEQAEFIRQNTEETDMIFSADSALVATEADRDVLTGMAGSDLFSGWTTEKCRHFNVLNFEIMEEYIENQSSKLLVYGDMSFGLSLPYLEPIPELQKKQFLNRIKTNFKVAHSFPNLMLPGTQTHYCLPDEKKSPDKILVFGLDAAAWDVLVPLCEKGFLPNISNVMNSGFSARMKTLNPTVSVMLWTTIATGLLPEHHGINNWLSEGIDTSGQLAITSDRRKAPAFWNIFRNRNLLVSNWWASWPAESINGVMISNRAHFPEVDQSVSPPENADKVKSTPRLSKEDLESELNDLNPLGKPIRLSEYLAKQLLRDRFYLDATWQQLTRDTCDLAAVFVRGIDILEHEYLRDVMPANQSLPDVPDGLQGIVQSYYRYIDNWIGKLQEQMGPNHGIIIVSDHGMDPVEKLPPLVEGLNLTKLFKKIQRLTDNAVTFAMFVDNHKYPPGLQRGLHWNSNDPVSNTRIARIIKHLTEITVDGEPLFTVVKKSEDEDETIKLQLNSKPAFSSMIDFRNHKIPVMSVTDMIIHPRAGQHWNSPDGIFMAAGPGIEYNTDTGNISILDILPTMAVWAGSPVSNSLDGKPRLDIFSKTFLTNNEPTFVDRYDLELNPILIDTPKSVEDSIRKELESLGYIQSSSN